MKASKENFQNLFENAGIALCAINGRGVIGLANKKFSEISGIKKTELQNNRNIFDFISGENVGNVRLILTKKVQKLGELKNIECIFTNSAGKSILMLLSLKRLAENKYIISLTDITSIKRSEKNTYLQKRQKEIARLASGIAHEIRNPLSAINTSVEILKDALKLSGQERELMNIILEENKHLDMIIKEFSYYARLLSPEVTLSHINNFIEETIQMNEDKFVDNIEVELKLQKDLPLISIDKSQMRTVFEHIINNAIEAMPEGGNLEISTSHSKNEYGEDQITIQFNDNGIGIKEENMEKIFKPFFSTKENNYGMGLTICERIIDNHNGEIIIQSKVDIGTKVTIHLPVEISPDVEKVLPRLI